MMATQDQYQMASLVDLEAREEASMSEIEHTIYTTQLALQEYTQWDRRYSSSVRMSESTHALQPMHTPSAQRPRRNTPCNYLLCAATYTQC